MKFSIIITAYNCAKYIEESINSCLNQTHHDFEVLVYNDGSTDMTSKKVLDVMKRTNKVTLFNSNVNKGALFGRFSLLSHCTGEVVCFLGGDDKLTRNCLKVLDETYKNDEILLTYGSWINEKNNSFIAEEYPKTVFENKSFRRSAWRATALNTFKKDLLMKVPEYLLTDEEGEFYTNCTDLAFSFPCLEMCRKENIAVIKEPIYVYNQHHSNNTLNRLGFKNKTKIREQLKRKPKIHKYYDEFQDERILAN